VETLFKIVIESEYIAIVVVLAFPTLGAAVAYFCRSVQMAKQLDGIEVSGEVVGGPELQ